MKPPYTLFFKLFVIGILACTLIFISSCTKDSDTTPQTLDPNCLISRIDYSIDHYELREYDSTRHLKSVIDNWEGAIARTDYTWNESTNSYSTESFQEVRPVGYEGPAPITPTIGTIQFNEQGRWVGTTITSKTDASIFSTYTPEYNKEGKLSKITYSTSYQGTNFESATTYEYSNGNLIKMVNGGSTTYFEYYPDKVAHPTSYAFLFNEAVYSYSLVSKNLPKKKTETHSDKNIATTITYYSYQYNDKGLPTEVRTLLEYKYPNSTDTASYKNMYSYQCF